MPGQIKKRIHYISNQIGFFSLHNFIFIFLYLLIQNLPLISTLDDISNAIDATNSYGLAYLTMLNNFFFFFTVPPFNQSQVSVIFNYTTDLIISLILIALFICAQGIDEQVEQSDSKHNYAKLLIINLLTLTMVCGFIPLGVFCFNHIKELMNSNSPFPVIHPITNLLALIWINYIYEENSNQNNYTNYSSLAKIYSKNQSFLFIIKLTFKIAIASLGFSIRSKLMLLLIQCIFFVLDIVQLNYSIFRKKYLDQSIQIMIDMLLTFSLAIEIVSIVSLVFNFQIIMNNFVSVVLTMNTLGFVALRFYKQHRLKHMLLEGVAKVERQNDAILLMFEYIRVVRERKNKNQIIFLGLIISHIQTCSDHNCFCHKIGQNQKQYFRYYNSFILMKIEQIKQKFQLSFSILNIYLNVKMSFMQSFSKSSFQVKKFKNNNKQKFTSGQQFMIFQMQDKTRRMMHQINRESIANHLDVIFQEDSLIDRVKNTLIQLNSKNIQKYSKMSSDFFNLNDIYEICELIADLIRQTEANWSLFKASDSCNMKLYELFLIYFEYMIHSKSNTSEIKNIMNKKIKYINQLKGADKNNLKQYLYTKKTCVIQSVLELFRIGIISNISKSCMTVFGVNKQLLIGEDIHNIMAEFLSLAHKKVIKDWLDQDTLKGTLLSLTNVFFGDRSNRCFSGKIMLKMHSIGLDLKFYGVLIKQNEDDYILLNEQFRIESIGKRLQQQQIFDKQHINKKFDTICKIKLQQLMKNKSLIRRKIIIDTKHSNQIVSMPSGSLSSTSLRLSMFECEVVVCKQKMGEITYYSIKFNEIRKVIDPSNCDKFQFYTAQQTCMQEQSNNEVKRRNTKSKSYIESQAEFSSIDSDLNDNDQIDFSRNIQKDSSQASSKASQYDLKFNKLIDYIKNKAINYHLKLESSIVIYTVIIVIAVFGLMLFFYLQVSIFKVGIKSVNQIEKAACTLISNNNLFNVADNALMMSHTYCFSPVPDDQLRCSKLKSTARVALIKMYNLMVSQQQNYMKSITQLSGMKYYEGLKLPVTLQLGQSKQIILAREFLQQCYNAVMQILTEISGVGNPPLLSIITFKKVIFIQQNWQTVKQVSHKMLYFYSQKSRQQLSLLYQYFYLVTACFNICVGVLLMAIYISRRNENQRKQRILYLYTIIPSTYCSYLKNVFSKVNELISSSYSFLEINPPLQEKSRHNKQQFKFQQTHSPALIILVFFLVIQSFNIYSCVKLTNLIVPAQQMVSTINNLIDAESYSFQNYFQLKTYYLQYNYSKSVQQISNQLLVHLNQTELKFITQIQLSISLFNQYDSLFQQQFNQMLTKDVCNLTQEYFSDDMKLKCQKGMHFDFLKMGLISTMNFLQRNTMRALIDLKNDPSINKQNYFKQKVFQDIDDYLFFMFQLYQKIEDRLLLGLQNAADITISSALLEWIFFDLMMLTLLLLWFLRSYYGKLQLGNLYGAVLQLPHSWLIQNKLARKILDDSLNFN